MSFSFGKSPAPAAPLSFGSNPSPAPATGFSFGVAPAPAAPQTSAFTGFGTAAAPAPAPTTPAFGGGASAFGTGAAGGFNFGSSTAATQQQQHQLAVAVPAAVDTGASSKKELEKLFVGYAEKIPGSNALNPDCKMHHVVYNQVDPSLRNSYTRPTHINEETWKKAEENNPDPGKLAPAALIGWESLRERLVVQQGEMEAMRNKVQFMRSTVANGLRCVALLRTRMEASRRTHLAQTHRFLKIQRKLNLVRCMNKPQNGEERQLKMRLEDIRRSLAQPQQTLKDLNASLLQGERVAEDIEEITDPEKLKKIFEALEGQRDGLEHLMRIVKKDMQDLEIVLKKPMALTL